VGADTAAVTDVLRAAGAPTDRITLSVNALLVREGHHVVLIDTGIGQKAHGELLESLHEAGEKPAAVTDVLITHSHGDHVGGLVDAEGHLAFPKATIRMSAPEWEFMQSKSAPDVAKVIAKKVHTFEPGAQVLPGIKAVPLKGHTPGHTGYEVSSGNDHLLYIGDLAHSSIISLAKPQWGVQFDSDGPAAKATRAETLKQLSSDQEWATSRLPATGLSGNRRTDITIPRGASLAVCDVVRYRPHAGAVPLSRAPPPARETLACVQHMANHARGADHTWRSSIRSHQHEVCRLESRRSQD
jgi:glyoxylase-like metal-dependent hydrolase (beta-lactamase superfamily II)